MILTILLAILIFGTLILLHELGHFLFARLFDVEINEFSIGFGPKLLSKKSKKTGILYSLRAVPLGGYVSMVGEGDDGAENNPRSLSNKKPWKKLLITAAGASVNILLGFILMIVYTLNTSTFGGTQVAGYYQVNLTDNTVMSARAPSGEGKLSACFLKGDKIISIDGNEVDSIEELEMYLNESSEKNTLSTLEVDRNGEKVNITVVKGTYLVDVNSGIESSRVELSDEGTLIIKSDSKIEAGDIIYSVAGRRVYTTGDLNYRIMMSGYRPIDVVVLRNSEKVKLEDVSFSTANEQGVDLGVSEFSIYSQEKNFKNTVLNAFSECRMSINMVFDSLSGIFTGRFGLRHMSGFVGTTEAIGEAAQQGFRTLLYFCALISVNIGIFNLLPLPALDGGHIVFYLLEVFRGKPIDPKYESMIHSIGMILLILLAVVVTVSDVIKLF